jgi:hypothetical protein
VVAVFVSAVVSDSETSGVAVGSTDPVSVVDGSVVEESVEGGGDESVVSADAAPCPVAMAVPTPSATARPPTRPTKLAAPMFFPPTGNPPPR